MSRPASRPRLRALAARAGILPGYREAGSGRWRAASDATREALLESLGIDASNECAAQRALAELPATAPRRLSSLRAIAPRDRLGTEHGFGIWTNLWSLRGARGAGIGSFSDLAALARAAGRAGAAFVGVSPLCATRNAGNEVSPYSAFSRLFHNTVYIDPERVPGYRACPEAQRRMQSRAAQRLRASERLDWAAVASFQRPIFEALYARARAPVRVESSLLRDYATFRSLEEHFAARGHRRDWRAWPAAFRDPGSPAVSEFRAAHPRAVGYFAWLEREAERQLAAAHAAALRAGAALGLYQDLPLGSVASGFDCWAFPRLFARGVSLGAPPDAYAPQGQDWQTPPLDPQALAASDFAFFRLLLDRALAHAGMLRIDHAMGLARQFWIPRGRPPSEGAYVSFPRDALLALVADASQRHAAVIVAEDLGTVPEGFDRALARFGLLSSRVLLFERDARGFHPASRWPVRALASANTHDLPTLEGWRRGRDLEIRRSLGILRDEHALASARSERAGEVAQLERRLGLGAGAKPAAFRAAVHAFLSHTPCALVGISLDDLAGEIEPANVPGVSPLRWPSWTRRMARPVRELGRDLLALREVRR